MKIATFNINNVNRRLPNLLAWLASASPDVVTLQELKSTDEAFPAAALRDAGYHAVWRGERTWNGVAILAKRRAPILIRDRLPGDPSDVQSRYIEAAVDGIVVAGLYAPNGNPQPGPKFDYKLKWLSRLQRHTGSLLRQNVPAVLAGDFNIVPTNFDIYPTRSWGDDALLHPKARAAYARLLKQGWCDALRTLHPDAPMFTFWDYKRQRWPPRRRPAARSSFAQPADRTAAEIRRSRSGGEGRGGGERSRAGMDHAQAALTACIPYSKPHLYWQMAPLTLFATLLKQLAAGWVWRA